VSIKRKVPKRRVTYFGWPGKSVKKKVIFDDFFAVENKKKSYFQRFFTAENNISLFSVKKRHRK
jgi:hypothetical protein